MSDRVIFSLGESLHLANGAACSACAANERGHSGLYEQPVRVTFSADLDPLSYAAVCGLLNAIKDDLDFAVVLDTDLVRAVVQGAHGSPSVGGHGPESRDATNPIVGAVSGVDSLGTPDTNPHGGRIPAAAERLAGSVLYSCPLPVSAVRRYSDILLTLLRALDGEVVDTALFGDCERELLDAERQEVDRIREFLQGRVITPSQPGDLRGGALAILDAFADEFQPCAGHEVPLRSMRLGVATPSADALSVGARPVGHPFDPPDATPSPTKP